MTWPGDPEAVAVDDPEAVPPCAVGVPLGTACFAQIATTTMLPDSSALPPSPDRSEKPWPRQSQAVQITRVAAML